MGKKYLETKKDTLESSILGVWQTAIEEGDARMDGRTKQYKEHRKKLEGARQRRESKKVNKEEVELDEKFLSSFLRITFKKQADVKKAMKVADTDFGRGYFMLDPARTRPELDIEGDKDDLENLKDSLKKAGIQFEIEMEEEVELPEGKMDGFLRLTFKSPADVKKAMKVSDTEFGRGYFMLDPARTRPELDLEGDRDDLQDLKDELKKAGIQFKIEMEESAVNPKDREELDAKDTAKKVKKAQEPAPGQMTEAQSGGKEEYQKFFNAALKKFKVNSPADLKGDDKKKFYDYVDKNWKGDNEKAEGAMSQVREFKIQSMKAALAQVWGMEEGKNPFKPLKKEDHDDDGEKKTKTETGKKPATIDLKPKIDDK